MTWHAIDQLEDAFTATKSLLLPVSVKQWVILGIVVFFISGATGFNPSFSFNFGDLATPGLPTGEIPTDTDAVLTPGIALLIALILGFVAVVVGIVLAYLGAVLEFVFVDIARTQDIKIRGFLGSHVRNGLSLFLLRIAVGIAIFAAVVIVLILTILTLGLFLLLLLVAFPILIAVAVGIWLFLRFTDDFVVPTMIAADVGLIEGWKLFWVELRAAWKQFGMYALVRIFLGFLGGILVAIGFGAIALILLLPFAIAGFGGVYVLAVLLGFEFAGMIWGGLVLFVFLFLVVVLGTVFVQVPVSTYLRYYSLAVLGAIVPEYDLLAEMRPEFANDSTPE